MTRRANLEEQLHRSVAQYLNVALPDAACWTTIPAGGGGKIRGAHLKAMGYRAGWPDIEIVWRSRVYYIELKAEKGAVRPNQKDCHADLLAAGAPVAVCRSIPAVEGTLQAWGFPLKATTITARLGVVA